MRWFTRFTARIAPATVAGGTEAGLRSNALAEALAVAASTFDFSHPIAPERHRVAEREPGTPGARPAAGDRR
jgi:hypothetical protein